MGFIKYSTGKIKSVYKEKEEKKEDKKDEKEERN